MISFEDQVKVENNHYSSKYSISYTICKFNRGDLLSITNAGFPTRKYILILGVVERNGVLLYLFKRSAHSNIELNSSHKIDSASLYLVNTFYKKPLKQILKNL